MPLKLNDVEAAALALPRERRAELAARLINSLDEEHEFLDPAEVERLCLEEVDRRYQRYLAGETKAVPFEEALARIQARVQRV